jgi:hypothetical protein
MSGIWVFLAYGFALGLALYLLYRFKALAWYWHLSAMAVALGMGFVAPPPGYDLAFGACFAFLMVWGLGGILMYNTHHPRHKHA